MHRKSAIRHVKQEIEKEQSNRVRFMFLSAVLGFAALMIEVIIWSVAANAYLHILPVILVIIGFMLFHEFKTVIPKRLEALQEELNSL